MRQFFSFWMSVFLFCSVFLSVSPTRFAWADSGAGSPRTLVLYDFETPRAGELRKWYPGSGYCEGSISRQNTTARTGRWAGRLDFSMAEKDGAYMAWDYIFVDPVARGAKELALWYRTDVPGCEAYCQVRDAHGGRFVSRQPLRAAKTFQRVSFDLTNPKIWTAHKRSEKGRIRYPILRVWMGVAAPGKKGTVDLDTLTLTTMAPVDTQPATAAELSMEPFGNLLKPGETPVFKLHVRQQENGSKRSYRGTYRVTDWKGRKVKTGVIKDIDTKYAVPADHTISLKGIKGSGAFCLHVTLKNKEDSSELVKTRAWFGILPTADVRPAPWVGVCVGFNSGWGNNREWRLFDILARAGIGVIRQAVDWPSWERTPGNYAVIPIFDQLADELAKRRINWNLKFYRPNTDYENPLDPDAHARFAAWLANHYKDKVTHFEIWNEPANCFFRAQYGHDRTGRGIWVDKFVEFTNKTARAVKEVHPDAKVLVAGGEGCLFRVKDMLRKGIGKHADMIAVHAYTPRKIRPETSEFFGDGFAALRAFCRRFDAPQRIAVTESGWTTCAGKDITHLGWAGEFVQTSYEMQAAYLIRMYLLSHAAGLEYALCYDIRNDGPRRNYTEHNFGLVHRDYSPKPSLMAIAALTRLMGDSWFEKELSPEPGKYRVQVYRVTKDHAIVAAWAVRGEHTLRLRSKTDQVERIDLMGNRRPQAVNQDTFTLRLTEIPIFIRVPSNSPRKDTPAKISLAK